MMKCAKNAGCVSELALGTFGVGGDFWAADTSKDYQWIQALRKGFELGIKLVDTSELYGRGHAEELVRIATSDIDDVLVITKIHPSAATEDEVAKRVAASAERLGRTPWGVALHWMPIRGHICDVVRALEAVVERGLAERYGLSNVTASQLQQALTCFKRHPPAFVENKYSLLYRRDELDVMPLAQREGLMYLAYSPLERGALALDPFLGQIASKYGKTAAQIALAWYVKIPGLVPVVKAARVEHVLENAEALRIKLSDSDWEAIDRQFYTYRHETR